MGISSAMCAWLERCNKGKEREQESNGDSECTSRVERYTGGSPAYVSALRAAILEVRARVKIRRIAMKVKAGTVWTRGVEWWKGGGMKGP
jgi:hypothetical protein